MLYILLDNYLKVLAPIIPHTCEEAYGFFDKKNKEKSVHLEDFADYKLEPKLRVDLNKWNKFFELKDKIYSELEKARNENIISKNNEAEVSISSIEKMPFDDVTLAKYLNVAKFESNQKTKGEDLIKIKNPKYTKCERCWNFFDKKEMNSNGELCKRCEKNVD